MNRLHTVLTLVITAFLGVFLVWMFAWAEQPRAGSQILNQAMVTYVDANGRTQEQRSNTVTVDVQQVSAFTLTSDQERLSAPGATVFFPHTLTNTGNGSEVFVLNVADQFANAPGTFAYGNIRLFPDVNGDGIPDSDIPLAITNGRIETPLLLPGQMFYFVAVATVPSTVQPGQTATLQVTGTSTFTQNGQTPRTIVNTDRVIVSNQAVVQMNKSLDVIQGGSPNDNGGRHLTFTLAWQNNGNVAATNLTFTDRIGTFNANPNYNTTSFRYVPNSARFISGANLTDAAGGDPVGINYQAITMNGITEIQFTLANVLPRTSGQMTFQVDVLADAPMGSLQTRNQVPYSYFDGANTQNQVTNLVEYNVLRAVSGPDLRIVKRHDGDFFVGNIGVYNLLVRNIGNLPTTSNVTVVDELPFGLRYQAAGSGGPSWTCSVQVVDRDPGAGVRNIDRVTCISNGRYQPGPDNDTNSPFPLRIAVLPEIGAVTGNSVNNIADVLGGGEPPENTLNNQAVDPTLVRASSGVSGIVWHDLNKNDIFENGEPLLEGWIVQLFQVVNGTETLVRTQNSDANGRYAFLNVIPANNYRIKFREPTGNQPIFGTPVNGDDGTPNPQSDAVIERGIISRITLPEGIVVTEQSLPVVPTGIVYDSVTRQPVPGAIVKIIGPTGFSPAQHLLSGVDTITTGPTGMYQFLLSPDAPQGFYRFEILPPPEYQNPPSVFLPPAIDGQCAGAGQPAFCVALPTRGVGIGQRRFITAPPNIQPQANQSTRYFLSFSGNGNTQDLVNNHLPLDPINVATGLFVEKSVSRAQAEIGDLLDYTVRVRNPLADTQTNVILRDTLPLGFAYVAGTARVDGQPTNTDGQPINQSIPGSGPELAFNIGTLQFAGAPANVGKHTVTVSYRVKIGVGARLGQAVNRVTAASDRFRSNLSTAVVNVVGGVFGDKGIIFGKIYVDNDCSHTQGVQEVGVPGVRIFLEDGTSIVTDSEGKYSIYGLKPVTHVVKVDRSTLPKNAILYTADNRNAGSPDSRFADLKNGEMHKADFIINGCIARAKELIMEVGERRRKGEVIVAETDRALQTRLNAEGQAIAIVDPRALPASGTIGGGNEAQNAQAFESVTPVRSDAIPTRTAIITPKAQVDIEKALYEVDKTLGFINLRTGDTLPIAQTNVMVKGPEGSTFVLVVNDKEIGANRIGKRSKLPVRQVQGWEYIGINLLPGQNTLTVKQIDGFGNERAKQTITVTAPDTLAHIELEMPKVAVADGHTPVLVGVRLLDKAGVPVTARTPLTLEARFGRWQHDDLDPNDPGVQIFIENGFGQYALLPPQEVQDDFIRVSTGIIEAVKPLPYVPELRQMLAVGVIEGTLRLGKVKSGIIPVTARDPFEQELREISTNKGDFRAAARAAFFIKGKVKGEYLLTAAYDSEKDTNERLFRDIQPDEFYPVYGDSGVKSFDAQSTGRLYVRVDKGRSYLLYGDYTTTSGVEARQLSTFNRSVNGGKLHLENQTVSGNAYASRGNNALQIDEIQPVGLAGPYQLSKTNIAPQSEKVEIVYRDLNQPDLIVQVSRPLVRFEDYTLDAFTGSLYFRMPQPSEEDVILNPGSNARTRLLRQIRVSYEVPTGGSDFWVAGADAQVRLGKRVEVGASIATETAAKSSGITTKEAITVAGVNATVKLADRTFLSGEVAHADNGTKSGMAERIELRHEGQTVQGRVYATNADEGFQNQGATITGGRTEVGLRGSVRLSGSTRLNAEAQRSDDSVSDTQRTGATLTVEQSFSNNIRLEGGVRYGKETSATRDGDQTTIRLKAAGPVPGLPNAAVFVEGEQDISDSGKQLLAAGAEYLLPNRGKIYLRHEFVTSLGNLYGLDNTQRRNSTVLGLDMAYTDNGRLFSEYRARSAFSGREAEAAVGLRQGWQLSQSIKLDGAFERITPLAGKSSNVNSGASTSASVGLEYRPNQLILGSTRLEGRTSGIGQTYNMTAGLAAKLNRNWTILGRAAANLERPKSNADRTQGRLQLGWAYRQTDTNRWNALGKYEHQYTSDKSSAVGRTLRNVDILSVNVNYQPLQSLIVSGRLAGKWVNDKSLGVGNKFNAQLLGARATYDISEKFDVGAQAYVLRDSEGSVNYALGAEIGYLVMNNLWLSGGYNFAGFSDSDLAAEEYTEEGAYVRLRYKFDETLFDREPEGLK